MASKSLSRLGGSALRRPQQLIFPQTTRNCFVPSVSIASVRERANAFTAVTVRGFHMSKSLQAILPDSSDPAPRKTEPVERPTVPTEITTSEYNQRADEFLEELVSKLEEAQEDRPDLEVDHSAGVLTVTIQSKDHTYVINKQPTNRQIWLSSPITGPKRFDWVVMGEGINQKEGGGVGDWVYLRDGTTLAEIARKELGVELGESGDADI